MELHLSGRNIVEIAGDLGVNKATVSRTISRSKKTLREETERAITEARLRGEESLVDLADPAALKAVMLALTPKQIVYFYLYYSEYLSLREIGELTGTDHAAICRTLRRALRNIGTLLGGRDTVLKHPEALDELAYQAFCELDLHPELVPESVRISRVSQPQNRKERGKQSHIPTLEDVSVRIRRPRKRRKPPGKLLSALLARREGQAGRWLEAVFTALLGRLRGRAASRGG